MPQKKPIFITITALCLVLAMLTAFTACGSASPETDDPSASGATAERADFIQKSPDAAVKYEMLWYYAGDQASWLDIDLVNAAINQRFADMGHSGLSVRLRPLDTSVYMQRAVSIVMSGEDYDMMYAPNTGNLLGIARAIDAWQPWDGLIEVIPEYHKLVSPYVPMALEPGPDGVPRLYRIFTMKDLASVNCALHFNKTVADAMGISAELYAVTSPQELDAYLRRFMEAYPERPPFLAGGSAALCNFFRDGGDPLGVYYDSVTDDYRIGVYEQWFADYQSLLRRWYSEGFIPDYVLERTDAEMIRQYGAEGFLISFGAGRPSGEAHMNAGVDPATGNYWGETWLSAPVMTRDSILRSSFGMSAGCKNPQTAAFIYEMICLDPTLNNLLNFGREGIDYSFDGTGRMVPTQPERYWPSLAGQVGNLYISNPIVGEPLDLGAKYDEFNKNSALWNNAGFFEPHPASDAQYFIINNCPNPEAVNVEINAIRSQYERPMLCGTLSDSDIGDIKARLEEVGAQAYVDVLNLAYDNWKKR